MICLIPTSQRKPEKVQNKTIYKKSSFKMCSGEESLPLCLVANFGSEADDIVVKEVLFKGQRIVENKRIEKGGFAWEVNNKYYTCR